MSYTRSYSSSVSISGSVTVNYPASEHGGSVTVPYRDTVPVDINVTVDTTPFDAGVSSANLSVDGLTASVAAMNAANCAAIAQSAKQVSDSIINGFCGLIRNDITTKKSETKTVIQTKTALLLEHSKAMGEKHTRMLADFEREKAKYGMVFSELDKELERRVTELDRAAFRLSRKVRGDVVVKPYLTVAADAADRLSAGGADGAGSNIAVASLRQKVSAVLHNLNESLRSNLLYRHMMRNSLWNRSVDEKMQQDYVPAAYCIHEDISSPQYVCSCYTSDSAAKQDILAKVSSYACTSPAGESRAIPEEEQKLIEQAFSNIVQDSYMSKIDRTEYEERVFSEIYRLWKTDYPRLKQI